MERGRSWLRQEGRREADERILSAVKTHCITEISKDDGLSKNSSENSVWETFHGNSCYLEPLKKCFFELGVVVHIWNPSTWEAKPGRTRTEVLSGLYSKTSS